MNESHDPDVTADLPSSTDSNDPNVTSGLPSSPSPLDSGLTAGFGRSVAPRSCLGTLRPVLLKVAEGESSHVVKPKSDAMPPKDQTGDRYQLSGEIARGGMGAVLRGRDVDLGRDLAVKVLLEKYANRPDVARRFVEEAQIGGQLQHPGVVPVYDIGKFGDRPFFTMKLVKGQTLAQILHEREEPGEDRPRMLGIALKVSEALAYAHAKGVIHRDLKPANIMVGAFGEVQVMDWGLAKVLSEGGVADEERASRAHQEPEDVTTIRTARSTGSADSFGTETEMGSLLGTPAYMPPEQANGDIANLDRRADVFGLGAILCEILTGKPPYVGRSSEEVRRKACNGDLADALSRLDSCGADAELIVLAKSCLSAEAIDRPKDAQEVVDGLSAYLAGVQERLRQAELAGVRERARRRMTTVVAVSLLALSVTGGLGFTYWLQQRQEAEARTALALREATLFRDQARANPDDTNLWAAALDRVHRAGDDLANGDNPLAVRQLANLSSEILAGAESAERNRALLEQLIDIRIMSAERENSETNLAYADAFKEAGIDFGTLESATVGKQIADRTERVRLGLVAALDHWATVRKSMETQGDDWPWLIAVARAADPDPDRDALRAALTIKNRMKRLEQVRPLVERADSETWAPASLVLLANTLASSGDVESGVQVLRRASWLHPSDVWIHHTLGGLLQRTSPPRRMESAEAYAAARALRPETGHDLAHLLEKLGRNEEAEAIFRDLVRRRPDSGPHLSCFAVHLKRDGRIKEAEEYFERAIVACRKAVEHNAESRSAHHRLAYVLFNQGQMDEAIVYYRKVIELDTTSASAHNSLGVALQNKGDVDDAISSYRKAIELDSKYASAHRNLANQLWKKDKLDDAIASYRNAIASDPTFATAHFDLGQALKTKGDVNGAIASYRKAIRYDPKYGSAHYNLGLTLKGKGDVEGAIESFKKAIECEPKYAVYHRNLGVALSSKGDDDRAIESFRKAIELDPKYAFAHHNLGVALKQKGNLDGAIASYRKAIESDPKYSIAHDSLGIAYRDKGDIDRAIKSHRKAVEYDPKSAFAHDSLGFALALKGNLDEAILHYKEAIDLDPKHPNALRNLINAWKRQGKIAESVVQYLNAIKTNPMHAMICNQLGVELKARNELGRAIDCFKKVIESDPKNGTAYYELGVLLNRAGAVDEAIQNYKKSIELEPSTSAARYPLANLLLQKGDVDGAFAAFDMSGVPFTTETEIVHSSCWIAVAALALWFDKPALYDAVCERALSHARKSGNFLIGQRAAHICSFRSGEKSRIEIALALARRTVEKAGPSHGFRNYFRCTQGMCEYRIGQFANAAKTLEFETTNVTFAGIAGFYRAMSLFLAGEKEEARKLAIKTTAAMKPLPKDPRNPFSVGNADDIIQWLAYHEAKELIGFSEEPPKEKK